LAEAVLEFDLKGLVKGAPLPAQKSAISAKVNGELVGSCFA
jgi:hypothetical protein